ncbi:MAG: response regulator, partial [Bdellovibrionales bacterium]|nr:response regulator [Bdellovibrionales bacterium]
HEDLRFLFFLGYFVRQTISHWEHLQIQHQLNSYSEELASARARAEDADKLKSEFLANMSHEIRTPMNGILGLTKLVLEEQLPESQRDMLNMVYSSAESLLTIINDILDFSKIEAGKLTIEKSPFSLCDCLTSATHLLSVQSVKKNIEFVLEIDEGIPNYLIGDSHRLRQVLVNLLGNAAKFTPEGGGIVVHVGLIRRDNNSLRLQLSIADSGIGIPPNKHESIFQSFTQADSSTTRKFGGTGLGLSITARLTELMGGTIRVYSIEGTGSTFRVELPFLIDLENDPTLEAHFTLKSRPTSRTSDSSRKTDMAMSTARILLVEDNHVNQRLAEKLLTKRGFEVAVAANGQEAVERTHEETFDLILMDIQMPVMGGFEATQLIRKAQERGECPETPIVAMTAHAMKGDEELCLSSGMDGYISKPIQPQLLFDLIDHLLNEN